MARINLAFFLISTKVSSLFVQLQVFRYLLLVEMLGVLIDLGLLKLQNLIYPRHLTWLSILVFFTYPSPMEFKVGFLAYLVISSQQYLEYLVYGSVIKAHHGPALFLL